MSENNQESARPLHRVVGRCKDCKFWGKSADLHQRLVNSVRARAQI